eukprot:6409620-Pyramimonas_sp.AAC.1
MRKAIQDIDHMKTVATSWLASLPVHKYTVELRDHIDTFLMSAVEGQSFLEQSALADVGLAVNNARGEGMKQAISDMYAKIKPDAELCLGISRAGPSSASPASSAPKRDLASDKPSAPKHNKPCKRSRKAKAVADDDESD